MYKKFTTFLSALLLLGTLAAQAQYYEFTDAKLGPYAQPFDAMGTGTTTFTNGLNANLAGIICGYRSYNSSGTPIFAGLPTNVTANDGSVTGSAAYNFGATGASDRALGGIAGGSNGNNGIGYICVRLRNSSSATIKNLDVRYAIEQWYNTSNATDAYFRASYRQYSNTSTFTSDDIVNDANWTDVQELDLAAPATGGVLGKVDGNSNTYRRTAQKRLVGVNMASGAEIVVRLKYVFNSSTNGNGISVDDIVIYPETNVLYSTAGGMLSSLIGTWGQSPDGSSQPILLNFAADNITYYVQGSNTASRLSGSWAVTGANSRIVVGTDATPATLLLSSGDNVTATIDVANGSTLRIADPLASGSTNLKVTLGLLAAGSTVEYVAGASQGVLAGNYSTLTLGGTSSPKFPRGAITVASKLNLSQPVSLQGYDLTLLRGAQLSRSGTGQVLATGQGSFRQTVLGGAAAGLLFPMALGTTAADYLPVTITSGSSDKDETYRVQAVNGIYTTYGTTGTTPATYTNQAGPTAAPTDNNLNTTWYIGHETNTPINATVQVGWVAGSREGSSFAAHRPQVYLDHYTSSTNTWDATPANRGASSSGGLWYVTRSGVSNFSPFAVTTGSNGPLPVQLVAFAAHRAGSAVGCTWTTASELNSAYFEVERSLDGSHFAPLGRVAGQGTSATAHTYTYLDAQPAAGLSYYRLRQTDADGTTSYSTVVTVPASTEAATWPSLVAVPNPSTGQFTLLATLGADIPLHGTVRNTLGQAVLAFEAPASAGALPLDLSAQPAGMYLVQVQGPAGPLVLRLLKQ